MMQQRACNFFLVPYIKDMTFEPAKNFLQSAARRFHLEPQMVGGIVLQASKEVIQTKYPSFVDMWIPKSFQTHTLTIQAVGSLASSQLYMRQEEFLESLKTLRLPAIVKEIKIVR